VWKYFAYDASGNRTLTVTSTSGDMAWNTLSTVLWTWWGQYGHNVGTDYASGAVATITRFNALNQAIEVREPQRERASSVRDDAVTSRAYNAFGEVAYEINANGARVDYVYNNMGRVEQIQSPAVTVTAEDGSTASVHPTEYRYY